jgi:hypothetical protein
VQSGMLPRRVQELQSSLGTETPVAGSGDGRKCRISVARTGASGVARRECISPLQRLGLAIHQHQCRREQGR